MKSIKNILSNCHITITFFLMQHGICFLFLLISTATSVYSPSYIGKLIDSVQNMQYNNVIFYSKALILLTIIALIIEYWKANRYNYFEAKMNIASRQAIMQRITNTNADFWEKYSIGNLETLLDKDIPQFNSFLVSDVSNAAGNLLSFLGIAWYILRVNVKLGVVIIGLVIFFVVVQKIYTLPLNYKLQRMKEVETQTNTYSNDILNNIESYYLIDNVKSAFSLYAKSNKLLFEQFFKIKNHYQISLIISQSFNLISIIVILSVWILDSSINLSPGQLINVILYTQKLYVPLFKIGEVFLQYKSFCVVSNRLNLLVKIPLRNYGSKEVTSIQKIEITDLTKKIDTKVIFDQFNMSIHKGKILGITGENGSGKTTLIKLLRRFDVVYNGTITINDVDINELSQESLLKGISVMPQKATVSVDDIEEIACYVNNNELLNFLNLDEVPKKQVYNYTLKSGGELQKICFLKVFLENKDVLILDEPTASMDMKSEEIVGDLLAKIKRDKIIIIITHRKYLLSMCDEIITLNA